MLYTLEWDAFEPVQVGANAYLVHVGGEVSVSASGPAEAVLRLRSVITDKAKKLDDLRIKLASA